MVQRLDSLNNLVLCRLRRRRQSSVQVASLPNPFVDFDNDLSNFTPSGDGQFNQ